jgi:hypothetical protein
MSIKTMSAPGYRRDLGSGLVLRWSTSADRDQLQQLYGDVYRDKQDSPPSQGVLAHVRHTMSGRHPLLGPGDYALVEDTERGVAVAATCLMKQEWEYDGISFTVGRPELVATAPDYRERGLVRAIFELIHARSAENGHLAQGITGIEYYYRQFGYEYALDLGGERSVYFAAIPELKADQPELYTLRNATDADLPQLFALYDRERASSPTSARIDEAYWRWMFEDARVESGEGWRTQLIVNAAGQSVGYVLVYLKRWGNAIAVLGLSVEPGISLPAVMPSILRALQAQAPTTLTFRPNPQTPVRIVFALGRTHPVYDALGPALAATYEPPYAWYVRVPELPRFIWHIAPALERRLADSIVAGYTGELRINFYRGGLRLVFDDGRLITAEDWNVRAIHWGPRPNAGFPPLVSLQLLFGRRSLDELRYAFPDVTAEEEARPVLEALFPAQPAWVLPLD